MNSESIDEVIEQDEQEEANNTGPGQLLCNKREALGLSVQEVADTLHITMHYVRALETDAHEKLPGNVFIKGYLRSYASLLGLDPDIVINVFNEYDCQREGAENEYRARRGCRKNNKNQPWIVISGIAFVVVAIALWYFNSSAAEQIGSTAAPTTRTQANASIAGIGTTRAVPAAAIAAQANTAEMPSSDVAERLITIEGVGEDTVQIRFTGESMVQVDDANDAQLYRDVRVAGDVLRINGTAPFNILLGDASNSELSLNGDPIDFRSNIRIDNSARLTIGL